MFSLTYYKHTIFIFLPMPEAVSYYA